MGLRIWRETRRTMLALGCAVACLTLGLASQAQAQNSCARIASELSSLHSGSSGGRTAQLQDAIAQQHSELARAQGAYDRYQCSFGAAQQCGSIVASINQMQGNLAQMQNQLARVGGGGGNNRSRIAELERVFATQCGPGQRPAEQVFSSAQPQGAQPASRQSQGLLATLFGIRSQPAVQPRHDDPSRFAQPGSQQRQRGFDRPGDIVREPEFRLRGGTFRTMCVRTSDGFYWPISFSTTRERFDEDRSLCAAMCPDTAVELFAYRNPGDQVDAMINTLTGEPYTAQSYAFAYRETFDPNNRCTPSATVLEDLRASLSLAPVADGPRVPQPSARPAMGSDPESRALQSAGTGFAALGAMTRPQDDGQQIVRTVGPSYGYFDN